MDQCTPPQAAKEHKALNGAFDYMPPKRPFKPTERNPTQAAPPQILLVRNTYCPMQRLKTSRPLPKNPLKELATDYDTNQNCLTTCRTRAPNNILNNSSLNVVAARNENAVHRAKHAQLGHCNLLENGHQAIQLLMCRGGEGC